MRNSRMHETKNGSRGAGILQPAAEAGVVLMNRSLEPIAVDEGAASILAAILEDTNQECPEGGSDVIIPESILASMRLSEAAGLSFVAVHFRVGALDYTGRAYLAEPQSGSLPEPLIVLHLQREVPVCDALLKASFEYGLTEREQEAIQGVAIGLTSKQVADRMHIKPNTVKAFLRLIMVKMDAPNRAGIVAKLLRISPGTERDGASPDARSAPLRKARG